MNFRVPRIAASMLLTMLMLAVAACGDDDTAADASLPDADLPDGMVMADAMDDAGADAGVDAPTEDSGTATSFEFEEPPIDPGVPVRFATAQYGPEGAQLMDIWLPESDEPTPVVIFYHGGGFVGGSRTSAHGGDAEFLRMILAAGIAWVGVDYRLVTDSSTGGVQGSLHDSRRGLQFVRLHADALNIDAARVGLTGGSAGAGTALWLALHDDMADPESDDPVERMSTRVSAATVWETQATYDLLRWPTDVYSPTYPMTAEELLENRGRAIQVAVFYGLPISLSGDPEGLLAELSTPAYTAYRDDIDMLDLMSPDDPTLYLFSGGDDVAPDARGFDLLHHPLHAMAVRTEAMADGVAIEANVPAFDVATMVGTVGHLTTALLP